MGSANGRKLITNYQTDPNPKTVCFSIQVQNHYFTIRADAEIIKAKQNDPNVIIVDARTVQEHFRLEFQDQYCINREEGLDYDNSMVIKYKDELQKDFEQRGITQDKEIICYCHSGTRAFH